MPLSPQVGPPIPLLARAGGYEQGVGVCGGGLFLMLAVVSYGTFGNAAAFYEIAAALRLDGERDKIKGVPLILIGFFVSTYAATAGFLAAIGDMLRPGRVHWHKTPRYRDQAPVTPDPAAPTRL